MNQPRDDASAITDELHQWLDARLAAAGRRRTGPVTVPRTRPWGTVMRADTDQGVVWLKIPARETAFEVALYPLLHRLAPRHILEPIAADPARGRLLLPDGGATLRDPPATPGPAPRPATQAQRQPAPAETDPARHELAPPAEKDTARGRIAPPNETDAIRGKIAPPAESDTVGGKIAQPAETDDIRGKIPPPAGTDTGHREIAAVAETDAVGAEIAAPAGTGVIRGEFAAALAGYATLQRATAPAAEALLAAGVTDMRPAILAQRLDEAVDRIGEPRLRARRAWFAEIAAGLAESRVPPAIDHADLHPGNVFRAGYRVYDWGDSVVGHPFGSMLVALRHEDTRARDAYLEAFTDLAPRADLLDDLRRARIAGNVIRALTWHRALHGETGTAFADGPAVHLRQLLTTAPWTHP